LHNFHTEFRKSLLIGSNVIKDNTLTERKISAFGQKPLGILGLFNVSANTSRENLRSRRQNGDLFKSYVPF
jgi:hypothetical protein